MRASLTRLLRHRDLVLALGFFAFGVAEAVSGSRYEGLPVWAGPRAAALVAVGVVTLPLGARRSHPLLSCAVVFGGVAGYSLAVGNLESTAVFLTVLVAAFSGTAYSSRPWLVVALASTAMGVHNLNDSTIRGVADWFWSAGFIGIGLLLGVAVRTKQIRIVNLEADADRLADEHRHRVAEATAAERAAIARELHDIVAHHVSVIVIQAQAGARSAAEDPELTERLLETIERTGRSALDDLRRLLRLLSADASPTEPAPGLGHVDDLVATFRHAGLEVSIQRPARLPALSGAADLAAYRTVQEALTNAMRHAAGSAVDVRITETSTSVAEAAVLIEVEDDGRKVASVPSAPSVAGAGRGLIGMRERLGLAGGGLLEAGHTCAGYRVRAWVPVEPSRAVVVS